MPRVLILRLKWVPFMDITGLQSIEEAIRDLQSRGVRVILTGANERVATKLRNAGHRGPRSAPTRLSMTLAMRYSPRRAFSRIGASR